MKVLLAAVNAKYIHSNLAVYCLRAYAKERYPESEIAIAEYTINQPFDEILTDLYRRNPDVLCLSCYLWNITEVGQILRETAKILPKTAIWLGGPEVSYNAREVLENYPMVQGIMKGEGEESFTELVAYYGKLKERKQLRDIEGLMFRDENGEIIETENRPILDLSTVPFVYEHIEDFQNRIIYYESSRGCPFSCSYCLSSIDKCLRFRKIELVKKELQFFIDHEVPQVKFVDRTFNCKHDHAMAIWKYITEHDKGITNFHFEVAADLLNEEEIELIRRMRPGLIQLEIGVQTTNPDTITEIRRKMNLDRLKQVVDKINGFHNIHQHLDLIVGLPYENYERFCQSFDDVYWMRPEQLQLGFLKVLTGSYMAEKTQDYGLLYHQEPPYEVLATKWLDYGQVLRLKAVEDMVEVHYNSGQYTETLREMEQHWASPYAMFEALADYYERLGYTGIAINRLTRYEILFGFLQETEPEKTERYRDLLTYDLYLRENIKSRPAFLRDESPWKTLRREFFQGEEKEPKYLKGYEGYDSRQMAKMAHLEVFGDGRVVVFDYKNRDPLTYNAKAFLIAANPA